MAITYNEYVNKGGALTDLASVQKSIIAAAKRAAKAGRRDKIEVVLPGGKYTLTKPFKLSAKETPELNSLDISFRAEVPGMAEISSLVRMDGTKFVKAEDHEYFTYDFIKEEGKAPLFRDFFLNFKKLPVARSRNFACIDSFSAFREGKASCDGIYIPMDIAERIVSAPIGGTEIMLYLEWDFVLLHVESIDLTDTKTEKDVTYAFARVKDKELEVTAKGLNTYIDMKNRETYIINAPGLVELNTFAYDYTAGVLYLNPANPEYNWCHAMEYPACEALFELEGVKGVSFTGITFRGTTVGYPCKNRYFSGQANTLPGYGGVRSGRLAAAAILARDVRNITVSGCNFRDLGTNGVQVVDSSVGVKVIDSIFQNVSMCGVTIGNPTWEWGDPKNRTFRARVENCYFNHIAYDYPSAPAIYIAQVDGLKLLHNTVEDCGYSAVSVGWNWNTVSWELGEQVNIRGAELAYNYFHNYMQLLKDGGAIYVLGSNCNHESTSERFNCMHDNFALLDERKNEYGKYGYYCDGSASNWNVYHSVVLNTEQMPIFSQPHPQALSYHNHFTDIWSNTTPHVSTHVPTRDIVRTNYVYDNITPEEYLEKYPEAKAIRDAAGCKTIL